MDERGNDNSEQKTRIGIASDHRGVELKARINEYLTRKGYKVIDYGTKTTDSVDYPDFGFKVAEGVKLGDLEWGILLCYTGIGMSMVANKVKGVRGALVYSKTIAKYAREHNNANVLILPAGFVTQKDLYEIIDIFLSTPFAGEKEEGNRHKRRIDKISEYEVTE
ncbi:RpiB/LacA/LacB family sugar-phosphate isomerase [bacterium]|nr:RpiB/LacA/LacB family sugar-phosphate isomerase [bacterium]